MLYPTKMKVKVSRYCKPKSPEHAVALWSPRHQHLLNPARTDFSVRSTSLFVYLSIWSIYLSLFRLAVKCTSVETSPSPWSCSTCGSRGAGSLWGHWGAPIFSPTVEKSSLPGLDFTSPCAGLAARRHPLKMKRRVTLGDCHQQHLQHQSGHGGHRHGGGGRALQLRGQLLLQGDLQTALQHQGPALSGVSSSPVREEVQGRAWHGAAVMHLGGGLHGGGGGQWWQGTMRGTLHNETNKPRHTVPQRGGAGNETFMCKGCTLRIDTWFLIEVTQSNQWSDVHQHCRRPQLQPPRAAQLKPAVVVVLFIFAICIAGGHLARWRIVLLLRWVHVAAGSMAESAAVFPP